MGQFKPASRPGSYQQQIAPVDNVSKLVKKQQRQREAQVGHNKQLADRHRDYADSLATGISVGNQARSNALKFDKWARNLNEKFELEAIDQAHASAMRNIEQTQKDADAKTNQLVQLVSKTLDTGYDIYKKREEAIKTNQYNALENIRLTLGTSLEDYHTIRSFEKGILDDENTTDARVQEFLDRGYSLADLRTIAGAREGVRQLSILNQVRSEIGLSPHKVFQTGVQVRGFPEGTTASMLLEQGDVPGVMQALNQHNQGILRMAREANGGNALNLDAVTKDIERSRASVMSAVSRIHQQQTTAKLQDEQQNHLSNGLQYDGVDFLADRWNTNPNLIHQDLKHLEYLATVTGSGVDSTFLSELRQKINPHTKRTYEQDYGVELDRINDAINKERNTQNQVDNLNRKDIKDSFLNNIHQARLNGDLFTAEGGTKIVNEARDAGLREAEVNEIAKAVNANMLNTEPATKAADIEWVNTVKNNPYLIGWTEEKIWEVAPTAKWAQKKITEMHTRQGRDADLKSAEKTIETALKTRLGEQIKDRYGSETFYGAYDAALEDYKTRRVALGKNGHKEALKLFKNELGDNKYAGIYAVPDVSKDTETIGFNNFQLSAVDINTEPKTYKSLSEDINKAALNPSLVSSRLAAVGNIDTSHLTTEGLQRFAGNHGNLNAPDDPKMWRKIQNIRDAIGGNTTTMDVATAILAARGVDIKTYEAPTPTADKLILEVQERHGKDVAGQFANGTATVTNGGGVSYNMEHGDGVKWFGPREVGDIDPDGNHSGANAHGDGGVKDRALGNYIVEGLQKLGYQVTEHPLAGGVTPNLHAPGEFSHDNGYKWDVPYSQFGPVGTPLGETDRQWAVKLRAAHRILAHGYKNGVNINNIVSQYTNIAGPNFRGNQ